MNLSATETASGQRRAQRPWPSGAISRVSR